MKPPNFDKIFKVSTIKDKLESEGFRLVETLHHENSETFIKTYFRKNAFFRNLYFVSLGILSILTFSVCVLYIYHGQVHFLQALLHLTLGVALAFLLTPLHEMIHYQAYKSQGANEVLFVANLKRYYFMAIANGFVFDKRKYTKVAIAPFATILFVVFILLIFAGPIWQITLLAIALTHTTFCTSDVAMLNVFAYLKKFDLVTFDDMDAGNTYFYGRRK